MDSIVVRLFLLCNAIVSDACVEAFMYTGVSVYFFASSAGHTITADAPSDTGEQSSMFNGAATFVELITASTLISRWNCALGFNAPFLCPSTAKPAICSRVVPYSYMCLLAIIAYNEGKVTPCCASHSLSAAAAIAGVASTTSVIFSTPAAITLS